MREPLFLRQNKDKWLEYEAKLFGEQGEAIDPDRLAELYVQLTDDLAYARTFYPRSQTVKYLNGLTARTHLAIYKNKKEKKNRLITFWTEELPLIYRDAHRHMGYAFLVFTFAFLIGAVSTVKQEDFVRVILGDSYVNMTIENIEKGDPMGVYKDENKLYMFLRIAKNNIQVSFIAFVLGVFCSVGTVWILFQNGVMLGAFLMFFHQRSLTLEAWPVIYIHGTLELSAIVMAGGAGFMLGNSILFPGTYTRAQSIQKGARKGIKILAGLVPVFILAAFLEGYVTRLTEMPMVFKLLIILLSLGFVVGYYILYPLYLSRFMELPDDDVAEPAAV
jgi:uncharacterized membrane protein SpoIIM required for sporulation